MQNDRLYPRSDNRRIAETGQYNCCCDTEDGKLRELGRKVISVVSHKDGLGPCLVSTELVNRIIELK